MNKQIKLTIFKQMLISKTFLILLLTITIYFFKYDYKNLIEIYFNEILTIIIFQLILIFEKKDNIQKRILNISIIWGIILNLFFNLIDAMFNDIVMIKNLILGLNIIIILMVELIFIIFLKIKKKNFKKESNLKIKLKLILYFIFYKIIVYFFNKNLSIFGFSTLMIVIIINEVNYFKESFYILLNGNIKYDENSIKKMKMKILENDHIKMIKLFNVRSISKNEAVLDLRIGINEEENIKEIRKFILNTFQGNFSKIVIDFDFIN